MKKLSQVALSLAVLFGASTLSACGGAEAARSGQTSGGYYYPTGATQNGYGYTSTETNCIGDRCYGNQNVTYTYDQDSQEGTPVMNNDAKEAKQGWFSNTRDTDSNNNQGWFSRTKDERNNAQENRGWFSNTTKEEVKQNLNDRGITRDTVRDNLNERGITRDTVRDNLNERGITRDTVRDNLNERGMTRDSVNERVSNARDNLNERVSNARDNNQDRSWFSGSKDSQNTKMNNDELARRVRTALENNRNLQSIRNIQITTDDGTVTLRGFVLTSSDKDKAESTAENVEGVDSVSNKLSIQNQNAPQEQNQNRMYQ